MGDTSGATSGKASRGPLPPVSALIPTAWPTADTVTTLEAQSVRAPGTEQTRNSGRAVMAAWGPPGLWGRAPTALLSHSPSWPWPMCFQCLCMNLPPARQPSPPPPVPLTHRRVRPVGSPTPQPPTHTQWCPLDIRIGSGCPSPLLSASWLPCCSLLSPGASRWPGGFLRATRSYSGNRKEI